MTWVNNDVEKIVKWRKESYDEELRARATERCFPDPMSREWKIHFWCFSVSKVFEIERETAKQITLRPEKFQVWIGVVATDPRNGPKTPVEVDQSET